jgi:hemerythrin-like domain-containing protein
MTSPAPTPLSIGQRLLDDHVHLATLCNQVVAAFEEGDRETCDAVFRELERDLENHLRFEERELLPRFARTHPDDAAAILAEHKRFRARLAELGVGVDLHVTRCHAVKSLVLELAEHARQEGQVLYRWADRAFDEQTGSALMARRHFF